MDSVKPYDERVSDFQFLSLSWMMMVVAIRKRMMIVIVRIIRMYDIYTNTVLLI